MDKYFINMEGIRFRLVEDEEMAEGNMKISPKDLKLLISKKVLQ